MNPQDTEQAAASPARGRRGRWRRWMLGIVLLLVFLIIAGELFARLYLGLGDPPLSIADDRIEYLFAPSQEIRRFGNRIHYNAYSMRSEDFAARKTEPNELRVMIFGDSVLNGGAQTDQSQLATTILQRRLGEQLNRPVIVGNISAGSWGPPNMLAYAERFGFFDADVVVLVLASHDYGDVPRFQPVVGVQPEFPARRPVLALQEGFTRYLLPRLRASAAGNASVPEDREPEQAEIQQGLAAVRELIELARRSGAQVIVAQFLEERELGGELRPGHPMIAATASQGGAELVQLGPAFAEAVGQGERPYRDGVHPNATGQRVMADALFEPLLSRLEALPAAPDPAPNARD